MYIYIYLYILNNNIQIRNSRQTKSLLSQDFRVMLLSRAFGTVTVMNGELQKI
jgi:hypothetical protein